MNEDMWDFHDERLADVPGETASTATAGSACTSTGAHAGGSAMRVIGTSRGDPDDPTRIVAYVDGDERFHLCPDLMDSPGLL